MNTLAASTTGLFSSQQMLLMLAVFSSVGLVVALMLLCAKLFGGKSATSAATIDADLERRRRILEVERLEIDNLERRQRLAREQGSVVAKAA